MHKTVLLFFVFLLSYPISDLTAQNLTVEIDQKTFDAAAKSLLLISDAYGDILDYQMLFDPAPTESVTWKTTVQKEKNTALHLTIINEYLAKKSRNYYFRAVSYTDIPADFYADGKDFADCCGKQTDTREITLHITEPQDISSYSIYPDTYGERRDKSRRKRTKIYLDHPADTDLLGVFFHEYSATPRLMYLENQSLDLFNRVHWDSLSPHYDYREIHLPSAQKWSIHGKAFNVDTGNNCTFYQYRALSDITSFDLYLPLDETLTDVVYTFRYIDPLYDNRTVTIKTEGDLIGEENFLFPPVAYTTEVFDKQEVIVTTESKNAELSATYRPRDVWLSAPTVDPRAAEVTRPFWTVRAPVGSDLRFRLPDLARFHADLHILPLLKEATARSVSVRQSNDFGERVVRDWGW